MKRKLKKRFFIALVLCISLFNFSYFYQNESKNNENLNITTIAYASDEWGDGGIGDDEWIIDPYNIMYSCIDWIEIKVTNLFVTDKKIIPTTNEEITSLPVEEK